MPQHVAVIDQIERVASSANANPRYRIYFRGGGTLLTATDSQINYAITNAEFRGVPIRFELNGHDQIIRATPEPEAVK